MLSKKTYGSETHIHKTSSEKNRDQIVKCLNINICNRNSSFGNFLDIKNLLTQFIANNNSQLLVKFETFNGQKMIYSGNMKKKYIFIYIWHTQK